MDHIRILRRAFHITFDYRILWVFGFILAITTGLRGPTANGGGGGGGRNPGTINPPTPPSIPRINLPSIDAGVIGAIIALVCLFLLVWLVFFVLRFVSETSLISMVNGYEDSGEKVGLGQGFRLGWSRGAFRIFLIGLVVGLVVFVAFILLMAVALAPLLLWLTHSNPLGALGTLMTVGLALLVIFALIVTLAVLSVLMQLFYRAAVLEDRGVFDSIRRGFELAKRRLGDTVIMGLIMFGLGLVFTALLVPVIIFLIVIAAVIGGLPAVLAGGLTNIFAHGAAPWIVAVIVGLPIFFLVLIVPSAFLGGIAETYQSAVWTIFFRELLALEAGSPVTPPVEPGPVEEAPLEPGPEAETPPEEPVI